MKRLLEKINKHVVPELQKQFGFSNAHMVPRLDKIVVNVGIRSDIRDPKLIDDYIRDLKAIVGQAPVKTRAKKSISSFKIREGQVIGLMVTLRGRRMLDFLDKLINASLPRVRDFRGLEERGFDRSGNYTMGMRDQLSFPEISPESVSSSFGLQITIAVSAESPEQARAFIRGLGLPLKNK